MSIAQAQGVPAPPTDPAGLTPAQARELFRSGLVTTTAGWCAGYTQANLIALPRDDAYDLLVFAQRNRKPCPVLAITEPGEPRADLFAGDLRTDIPAYRVYEHGELVAETTDVTAQWTDDMVGVLLGCSFTFESALLEADVPIRHLEQRSNVPMYSTSVACSPAGRLHGPLVVSMRPMPADSVATAVRVTARYPDVHGAPVHVGDPAAIGITDLDRPDFGDPVELRTGEIPVFWACGVTPQAAVMASRPRLAIAHAPGHMAITDARDSQFQVP